MKRPNLLIDGVLRVLFLLGVVSLMALSVPSAAAQTDAPPPPSLEMRYYDFWPGYWARIVNGRVDTKASSFRVTRGIHAAAFEEEWRQVDEKGVVRLSRAIRAWEKKRFSEAEKTYKFIISSIEKFYGPRDSSLIEPLNEYAKLLRVMKRPIEATKIESRVGQLKP